jgi:hypothetical protein
LSDTLEPKRADVATLAGKSTLNRLELGLKSGAGRYHKISVIDAAMEKVFLDIYLAAHRSAPQRIILDLDATDASTAATCWSPSSGRPTAMPRPVPRRRLPGSSRTFGLPGPRSRSGCARTRASPATS